MYFSRNFYYLNRNKIFDTKEKLQDLLHPRLVEGKRNEDLIIQMDLVQHVNVCRVVVAGNQLLHAAANLKKSNAGRSGRSARKSATGFEGVGFKVDSSEDAASKLVASLCFDEPSAQKREVRRREVGALVVGEKLDEGRTPR